MARRRGYVRIPIRRRGGGVERLLPITTHAKARKRGTARRRLGRQGFKPEGLLGLSFPTFRPKGGKRKRGWI